MIESFSVGGRAVLSDLVRWKVLAAAGSKFFMALVSRSRRKQHVWKNLLQVLARELNHFKQQHKALRQASQLCCFGLQMQFITVLMLAFLRHRGEQDRTEVGSKAPPAVAKSSPTAAKLGCAFSHNTERIVDELGLLYPEYREICGKTWPAYSV